MVAAGLTPDSRLGACVSAGAASGGEPARHGMEVDMGSRTGVADDPGFVSTVLSNGPRGPPQFRDWLV